MPLIQGKSKEAFGHNVGAEMKSGRPQKQALAIAYSIKRKNAGKKMNEGGMVENEKLNPSHEAHVKSIVEDFFNDKMGYSMGGMVESQDPAEEMEAMSQSGDDFLSHDNDNTDELSMNMMPEGFNESEDGADEMMNKDSKKKKILQSIMDSFR